jgi:hypothetical protein
MTGFYDEDGSGSVQLYSLLALLCLLDKMSVWDLGMFLPYKGQLGATTMDRADFVKLFREKRDVISSSGSAGKSLLNGWQTNPALKPFIVRQDEILQRRTQSSVKDSGLFLSCRKLLEDLKSRLSK